MKRISRQEVVKRQLQIAMMLGLKLSKVQLQVLKSEARNLVWISGARSGKSWIAGHMGAAELTLPDRHIWVVGPTYELARKEFDHCWNVLSLLRDDEDVPLITKFEVTRPKEGSCSIRTPYGSWMETKSTENPKNLFGEELNLMILAEASSMPLEPYERMLIGRISSRRGRILAPSTGAGDMGLFSKLVEDAAENSKNGDKEWELIQSNTLDANPTFSREEYELRKATMDEQIFREQFGGEIVSRRGLVFKLSEDSRVNLTPGQMEEVKRMPIFAGIKYNYTNGCSVSIVAYDTNKKQFIVIKDFFLLQIQVETIIKEVIETLKGFRFNGFIADCWDTELCKKLRNLGVSVTINNEERKLGKIGATMARVRKMQSILAEKRLAINGMASNSLEEVNKCKWPDKKKEGSDMLEGETPLPKYFQVLDTISYVTYYVERG